nr:unnamed protein product [Callosobruchus analis]
MRIKAAGPHLPVVNYDVPAQEASFRKHGALFGGESKRALIVGASGSGKTNIMISLITHPNGLRFSTFIFTVNPIPTEISIPTQRVQPLKDIGYFEYTEEKDIIPPNLMKPNSLIIFDDVASSLKTLFVNTLVSVDIAKRIASICVKPIQLFQNTFCAIMQRCSLCYHKIF